MLTTVCRWMALCLAVAPAASAATVFRSDVFTIHNLPFADARPGLDWNVRSIPASSPLAFLEEPRLSASDGIALPPMVVTAVPMSGPLAEELERRAFGWIAVLVGGLLAAMQFLPKVHSLRVRLKSVDIRVPVH